MIVIDELKPPLKHATKYIAPVKIPKYRTFTGIMYNKRNSTSGYSVANARKVDARKKLLSTIGAPPTKIPTIVAMYPIPR